MSAPKLVFPPPAAPQCPVPSLPPAAPAPAHPGPSTHSTWASVQLGGLAVQTHVRVGRFHRPSLSSQRARPSSSL